jgi:hypothetical protein
MRKATEHYFSASAVVLIFNQIQSIIVTLSYEVAFSSFKKLEEDEPGLTSELCFRLVNWFLCGFLYLYELY